MHGNISVANDYKAYLDCGDAYQTPGLKTIKDSDRKIYRITDDIDEVVKAADKIGHRSIYDNIYNDHESDFKLI